MQLASLLVLEAMVLPNPPPDSEVVKKRRGFMVALVVPPEMEEEVARAGGWAGGERTWSDPLHCTVAYVMDPDRNLAATTEIVRRVAKQIPSFSLVTTRAGFFRNEEKDGALVHYCGCAAPELDAFVGLLRRELDAAHIEHDTNHPLYVPHITLEYVESPDEMELRERLLRSTQSLATRFVPTLAVVNDDQRDDISFSSESSTPNWQGSPDMGSLVTGLGEALDAVLEADPVTGRSSLHKHMVAAVYKSLRKRGSATKDAATGAFKITNSNLKKNGYQGKGDSGRLTGSGANRSKNHAAEPAGERAKKDKDYAAVKKLATA
jgi:2'-5' RNA ligase